MRSKRSNQRLRRWFIWPLIGSVLMALIITIVQVNQLQREARLNDIQTVEVNGISIPARAGDDYLQVYRSGAWHDYLIKGVNMGVAKPGHFPGETAITKDEYYRWFEQIGEMHANTVRVYTLHPPEFYEALKDYNEDAKEPIMVLHGLWINEEKLVGTGDAFSDEVNPELQQELRDLVNVIHGKADLPVRPGHASGKYRVDISKYVLGWVLGVEWDPEMVVSTNRKNEGKTQFDGIYFQTQQASPFEIWLAGLMEDVAKYEADTYHWQRPFSFTNWVTTDLLEHPSEPSENEDLVSVNPGNIETKPALLGGYFASYHVYPYYPEFMNYDKTYSEYKDFRGEANGYAGYLNDLKRAHHMPVLIAEFGVPSSRGMTHRNVNGWNQGFHSEAEQGAINARLFEDIVHEKMAGGLVFSWQDEWFKRTWNNMDLDNPDRRPFWSNAQTSEQQFGLLSFDPNVEGKLLQVDGDPKDWDHADIPVTDMGKIAMLQTLDSYDAQRHVEQAAASVDERYVYFRLNYSKDEQPFDWKQGHTMILLDTVPDQGEHQVPGTSGLTSDAGFDFVIDLSGPDRSRIWVDSYYDPFYYQYGHMLNMIPAKDYAGTKNNGRFHPIQLTLNKELTLPESGLKLPFDAYETGRLRFGNSNPASDQYDSLADAFFNEKERVLEVRIPWQLLNVKDPSTHEVMGDLWKDGLKAKQIVTGFKFAVVTYKPKEADSGLGEGEIAFTYPAVNEGRLLAGELVELVWKAWEQPQYHERLKTSYYTMKDVFLRTSLSSLGGNP